MQSEEFFRYTLIAIFVVMLSISKHYRTRARRLTGTIPRRQEGRWLIAVRVLSGLPPLLSVFVYMIHPDWMNWSQMEVPGALRWSGAVLGLASMLLAVWVFRNLGSNVTETTLTKADHRLVTTGPYRFLRHPLYLVGFIAFTGFALLAANWFMALCAVLLVLIFRWVIIPREEAALVEKFGDGYVHYRQRTGALLPVWRLPN